MSGYRSGNFHSFMFSFRFQNEPVGECHRDSTTVYIVESQIDIFLGNFSMIQLKSVTVTVTTPLCVFCWDTDWYFPSEFKTIQFRECHCDNSTICVPCWDRLIFFLALFRMSPVRVSLRQHRCVSVAEWRDGAHIHVDSECSSLATTPSAGWMTTEQQNAGCSCTNLSSLTPKLWPTGHKGVLLSAINSKQGRPRFTPPLGGSHRVIGNGHQQGSPGWRAKRYAHANGPPGRSFH